VVKVKWAAPSPAGVDARRRDAGDAGVHRRGAATKHMPPRAAGTHRELGRRASRMDCGRSLRCSSSTMCIDIATSCRASRMPFRRLPDGPVPALTSPRKTQARSPLYFYHGLLALTFF